jgi:hypothetical protein
VSSAQQQELGAVQQGQGVPADKQVETAVKEVARRFRIGVEGGVGLDPELIMFGAHGSFGPYFDDNFLFRPGVEFGIGEVTTLFGVNLDATYSFFRNSNSRWVPYIGAGPNFAVSHQSFEAPQPEEDGDTPPEDDNRFDFSDTDFETGVNFIAGARRDTGLFVEMRVTAWGVSNFRVMVGFNF